MVKYAVLGIGHSAWPTFCAFPKYVDQRLQELEGERIYEFGQADELTGFVFFFLFLYFFLNNKITIIEKKKKNRFDKTIESWTENFCKILAMQTPKKLPSKPEEKVIKIHNAAEKKVFQVPISWAKYISKDEDRKVIQLEFDIKDYNIKYKPGDHICIYGQNNEGVVKSLLKRLGATGNEKIKVPESRTYTPYLPKNEHTFTLKQALTYLYDFLRWPTEPLLKLLATHTKNPNERQAILSIIKKMKNPSLPQAKKQNTGKNRIYPSEEALKVIDANANDAFDDCVCKGTCKNYPKKVKGIVRNVETSNPQNLPIVQDELKMTLPVLLASFPSCTPPIKELIETLPFLAPRYYSISCSPLIFPTSIQIVISVKNHLLNFKGATFERKGVVTSFIENVCSGLLQGGQNKRNSKVPSIYLSLRPSSSFTLPEDLSKNLIMISTGTGIAPFRSFLQHLCYLHHQSVGNLSSIPSKAFGCEDCPMNLLVQQESKFPDIEDAPGTLTRFGKCLLFFGCRDPKKDFLFQEELETLQDIGVLDQLTTSFSRLKNPNPNSKIQTGAGYIQHSISKEKDKICQAIERGEAVVYVCGGGEGMLNETHQALKNAIGEEKLDLLHSQNAYVRELWED